MQQVAVAVFDVHEVRADVPRDLRSTDVILNEPLDFVVGKDLRIACDLELRIENRMPKRNARFIGRFAIGFAEAPRVRELKADH